MNNVNKLIKLIEEGVDPNTIVNGETIFIRLIDMPTITSRNPIKLMLDHGSRSTGRYTVEMHGFRSDMQQMIDRGANPNSRNRYGRYAIEICAREDELILMRYGATKYNNCDEESRVARRINRVLIICDMMLYMDDGVPSDWIREIKECLY